MGSTDEADRRLARRLAELHHAELPEGEFSRHLGLRAIEIFYEALLTSEHGRVFYTAATDGQVISLCCVVTGYDAFSRALRPRLMPMVLWRLLTLRLPPRVLLRELGRGRALEKLRAPSCHLGMIVRNPAFGPAATLKLLGNFREAIAHATDSGAAAIWASAHLENRPSSAFLCANGFAEVGQQDDIVLFERILETD